MTTKLERTTFILENISLAEKIAKSRKKKLSQVSYDELKSAAYLGLVEAANKYDPQENDNFPAYAVWRIVGAVRDYLRELSWGSRSNPIKISQVFIYEEELFYQEIENKGFFEDVIRQLPSTNKTVLGLYYLEGMKIKEIAQDMSVHESRISQILTDSKVRLRKIWKERESELWSIAA